MSHRPLLVLSRLNIGSLLAIFTVFDIFSPPHLCTGHPLWNSLSSGPTTVYLENLLMLKTVQISLHPELFRYS